MQPKVSVSLITYNHEKYIAHAIESVVCQKTDFPFELVIGEDCSTDKTRQIVELYARRFPELIRVADRPKNLGLVRNAIQTISDCRGEYIALLEGDDYWVDDCKLQKQSDFLDRNNDCAFCFTNAEKFIEGTERRSKSIQKELPEKFDIDYFFKQSVDIPNNTKMFRASVHPIRFNEWYFSTIQWDWVLHILHATKGKIGYLNFIGLDYRRHEDAFIISTKSIDLYESGLKTMECLNKELDFRYDYFFRVTWWHYEQLALEFLRVGNLVRFFTNLVKTIYQRPNRSLQEYRDLLWKIRQTKHKETF